MKIPVIINFMFVNILSRIRSTVIGGIFADSAVVIVTQIIAMAMVFFYSMVTASWFGVGAEMDAFVMANTVPNYIVNLVTGGFAAAMIPTFISAMKHEGPESAQQLFSNIGMLLIVSLALIGIVSILSGKYLLAVICIGFDHQTLTLATNLYYILVPAMIFTGLIVQWSAGTQCFGLICYAWYSKGFSGLVRCGHSVASRKHFRDICSSNCSAVGGRITSVHSRQVPSKKTYQIDAQVVRIGHKDQRNSETIFMGIY